VSYNSLDCGTIELVPVDGARVTFSCRRPWQEHLFGCVGRWKASFYFSIFSSSLVL
jgi:hypothetical protein